WPRFERECAGCGEPLMTPLRRPFYGACSERCHQRDYRKRRRGHESVVQWKDGRPHEVCAVCKQSLDKFGQPNKRKDAIYCSPACRQCAYRQRRRELEQEQQETAA